VIFWHFLSSFSYIIIQDPKGFRSFTRGFRVKLEGLSFKQQNKQGEVFVLVKQDY
jgi:hypothetical protein